MKRYILVEWPKSKGFMSHPRFNECYHTYDPKDLRPQFNYVVPEDLYEEVIQHIYLIAIL